MDHIYQDITVRTGGNVYIGVVGPVRTGKSTLIKRIMEILVLPRIGEPYRAQRARDELPQSGSGRTIMTSEPKFIPEEAVEICPDGKTTLRLRFIDSVGYMVPGAVGADEDGQPRMVNTSWFDHPLPMTEAAELGTEKVIREHATIGIVVTTDGTVTDIPRQDYAAAEERAIRDMQSTGKPFLVVVNTRAPGSAGADAVQNELRSRYGVESIAADCQTLDENGICQLFEQLLYSFPLTQLRVYLPRWMNALEDTHPIKAMLYQALQQRAQAISTLAQAEPSLAKLLELEQLQECQVRNVDLATGTVDCVLRFPEKLFYEILSQRSGCQISNDAQLMQLLAELVQVKQEYDQVADALAAAKATGYGIVMPTAQQMQLHKPEMIRKGGNFGVKLQASAHSIHMLRVDVDTQLSPIVGSEQQSKELVEYLSGEEPENLWESNIFGKSVGSMIQEGLSGKLLAIPEDVREKFRGTLCRVVNDGANGLICLIL